MQKLLWIAESLIEYFLFWPIILLQPSYIDPDAVIVAAFYQILWFFFLILVSTGILYWVALKKGENK